MPVEVYHRHKDRLPENFARRAGHYYTEYGRVQRRAAAKLLDGLGSTEGKNDTSKE